MKQTLIAFFITLFIAIVGIGGYMYYSHIEECKAPLYRSMSFGATDVNVDAFYNDKYDVIKVDLTVYEIIEDWQIDMIGSNTEFTLVAQSMDSTLKKEFNFKDIFLKSGENIKGSLTIENVALKDFVMIKDLLNGNMTISYSKVLNLDSTERNKLKQEYYKKKEEARRAEAGLDALGSMAGMMMLGSMLGF